MATESTSHAIVSCHRAQHLFDVKRPISYRSKMASVSRSLRSNIVTSERFRAVLIRKRVSVVGISDWKARRLPTSPHAFKGLCCLMNTLRQAASRKSTVLKMKLI